MDPQMMPPQFQGQPSFPHMRNHTPSASPPIANGVPFQQHPGHPVQRGHTPQAQLGSRPASRNDSRRMGPGMMPQQGPPQAPPPPQVNGYAFMPNPAIYNPQNPPPMQHGIPAHNPQYPYPPPQPHGSPPQAHPQLPPQYMDDQRRSSIPPNYPPPVPQQGPIPRPEPSPQQHPQQLPQPPPHISPPPPQPQQLEPHPPQQPQPQEPQLPAPMPPKSEPPERPRVPLLNTDTAIKRLPQRKQHSIFTPIDENRSILSQHLASFTTEPERIKTESNRSQSVDGGSVSRNENLTKSPPRPQRANTQTLPKPRPPVSIPETTFTPPSRSNSLKVGGGVGRGPRLKVQIPNGGGQNGDSATAESTSPRNPADATPQTTRPPHMIQVLPPPSPSASARLSAGATGPPNPFARPPPPSQNNGGGMNIDTPVSALPSRFLNTEFLPSPSSFYPNWDFRGNDSNTLASPLNFATPVVGTGPSFLRDDNSTSIGKRKSPEAASANGATDTPDHSQEPKRVKVD